MIKYYLHSSTLWLMIFYLGMPAILCFIRAGHTSHVRMHCLISLSLFWDPHAHIESLLSKWKWDFLKCFQCDCFSFIAVPVWWGKLLCLPFHFIKGFNLIFIKTKHHLVSSHYILLVRWKLKTFGSILIRAQKRMFWVPDN